MVVGHVEIKSTSITRLKRRNPWADRGDIMSRNQKYLDYEIETILFSSFSNNASISVEIKSTSITRLKLNAVFSEIFLPLRMVEIKSTSITRLKPGFTEREANIAVL